MCLYHDFYGLFTAHFLYEEVMSTIVKFSNRSIQNLFNVGREACMDSRKLYGGKGTSQFPAEFVNFNLLSYCLGEIIGFDVKISFASRPVSHLIRWYNKRILRKGYSVRRDFSWIENYKLFLISVRKLSRCEGNSRKP